MATLLDSYSETNVNNPVSVVQGVGVRNQWVGQSFITPNDGKNYKISSAKFNLKKSGSPTGTYTFKLYAHSGTFGTSSVPGTLLATSASANSADLTTSYQNIELTFSGAQQYQMSPNTYYVIELDGTSVAGDGSNVIIIGEDDSSPSAGGNENRTDAALAQNSSAVSGSDVSFYVYGDEVLETTISVSGATVILSLGAMTTALTKTISEATVIFSAGILDTAKSVLLSGATVIYSLGAMTSTLTKTISEATVVFSSGAVSTTVSVLVSGATTIFSLGSLSLNFVVNISGGVVKFFTGVLKIVKDDIWEEKTKHISTWTNKDKNDSTWSGKTKNSSNWTNKNKS